MKCPVCGGTIIETEFVYECEDHKYDAETNKKSGCNFIVFRQLLNKKIGRETFEKLLSGETIHVKNFVNKKKKKFDADIRLLKDPESDNEYKIKLIFKDDRNLQEI